MGAKIHEKSRKSGKKRGPKIDTQKEITAYSFSREARGTQAPKATYYQQDFLRKNNKKENNLQETYLKTN